MLTDREKEVYELVIKGLTNKEIASELNISFHTAKAHVAAILKKLDAKNRFFVAMDLTEKCKEYKNLENQNNDELL